MFLSYSNPLSDPFYNRIVEFRSMYSLSQSSLADALGISRSLLGQIERGVRIPCSCLVNRFLEYFHCRFFDLFVPPAVGEDCEASNDFWWTGNLDDL